MLCIVTVALFLWRHQSCINTLRGKQYCRLSFSNSVNTIHSLQDIISSSLELNSRFLVYIPKKTVCLFGHEPKILQRNWFKNFRYQVIHNIVCNGTYKLIKYFEIKSFSEGSQWTYFKSSSSNLHKVCGDDTSTWFRQKIDGPHHTAAATKLRELVPWHFVNIDLYYNTL